MQSAGQVRGARLAVYGLAVCSQYRPLPRAAGSAAQYGAITSSPHAQLLWAAATPPDARPTASPSARSSLSAAAVNPLIAAARIRPQRPLQSPGQTQSLAAAAEICCAPACALPTLRAVRGAACSIHAQRLRGGDRPHLVGCPGCRLNRDPSRLIVTPRARFNLTVARTLTSWSWQHCAQMRRRKAWRQLSHPRSQRSSAIDSCLLVMHAFEVVHIDEACGYMAASGAPAFVKDS